MLIALDPYMLRRMPLPQVIETAGQLGYKTLELSPREDFLPFYVHPRAGKEAINALKAALRRSGVSIGALLIGDYKWSSAEEGERIAAVRYWRSAIEIADDIECPIMAAEFGGRPDTAHASEAAFWRSMEELLPSFVQHGITLTLEPHPYNFVESNNVAVDMIRAIDSPNVRYLYCAPHTFHMGDDMAEMLRYGSDVLAHVHVADSMDHRGSSGIRFIVNPAGAEVRVHQHLNIGEGEVDWDTFFRTLREIAFDGLVTNSVFGREESALESARYMLERISHSVSEHRATKSRERIDGTLNDSGVAGDL